jgi:hypothetical protein
MTIRKTIAGSVALLCFAACSNSPVTLTPQPTPAATSTPTTPGATPTPTATVNPTTQFVQIERLSRPAIKEAFQHHQISNAVEPYQDPTIQSDIVTTEDAIRPPNASVGSDYGKLLSAVLYPDEYLVNLNGGAPSGADPYYFLSGEVDGSSAFGGRAPNDDVIGLELETLFGGVLPALKLQPEDGEENDCLELQNIKSGSDPAKSTTSTFPYLPVAR